MFQKMWGKKSIQKEKWKQKVINVLSRRSGIFSKQGYLEEKNYNWEFVTNISGSEYHDDSPACRPNTMNAELHEEHPWEMSGKYQEKQPKTPAVYCAWLEDQKEDCLGNPPQQHCRSEHPNSAH